MHDNQRLLDGGKQRETEQNVMHNEGRQKEGYSLTALPHVSVHTTLCRKEAQVHFSSFN